MSSYNNNNYNYNYNHYNNPYPQRQRQAQTAQQRNPQQTASQPYRSSSRTRPSQSRQPFPSSAASHPRNSTQSSRNSNNRDKNMYSTHRNSTTTITDDDEALARALQEEYEREYRRRSMQQHLPPPPNHAPRNQRSSSAPRASAPTESFLRSAPPAVVVGGVDDDDVFGKPFYNEPDIPIDLRFSEESEVEITDEDYARQLGEEFQQEEIEFQRQLERVRKQQQQQQRPSSLERTDSARDRRLARAESKSRQFYAPSESNRTESMSDDTYPPAPAPVRMNGTFAYDTTERAPPPRRNSRKGTASTSGSYLSDAEYALRLQQEEQDEQLARQWIAEEQARRNNAAAIRAAQQGRPQKKTCCQKFLSCMCCLIIVAMVVGVCLYFFVFSGQDVQDWWKDPQAFQGEDPFNNANPDDANLWRTADGRGLELTILNCLDNTWQDYFIQAVDDWDSGVPDALSLKTETGTPESVCTPVDSVMKVCNGDYGETNWRGINKILLENGFIYSSAARMNEFYFGKGASNDQAQRQYTMCHEMGHGFGLPHTDENFNNKDLGNCMDYTMNPENNKQPAFANFLFLSQLYGTLSGSKVPEYGEVDGGGEPTATSAPNDNSSTNSNVQIGNEGNRTRKNRRRRASSTDSHSTPTRIYQTLSVPPEIAFALEEIDILVDRGEIGSHWRRLHESAFGVAHEIDLGQGYTVQIHMLKASGGPAV